MRAPGAAGGMEAACAIRLTELDLSAAPLKHAQSHLYYIYIVNQIVIARMLSLCGTDCQPAVLLKHSVPVQTRACEPRAGTSSIRASNRGTMRPTLALDRLFFRNMVGLGPTQRVAATFACRRLVAFVWLFHTRCCRRACCDCCDVTVGNSFGARS